MRRPLLTFGISFLVTFSGVAQQQPSFRAEVNLINVTALVKASDGGLITDLSKEDFEVFEDGVPQRVQFFAREKEIPLSLALIVDASGSQDKFIDQHNRDVERFLATVLAPADRAVAVCFGNHLRMVSDTTASTEQIMDGLRRFAKGDYHFPEIGPKEPRELGTALYDAIYFTTREKLKQTEERRKAIVLFSDGEENSSEHDLLDALEAVQNEDTLIYSIRYTDSERHKRLAGYSKKLLGIAGLVPGADADEAVSGLNARNRYGIRVMRHLANQSGGNDFDALESNLGDVFSEIGNELHSLYSLGYLSTNPKQDGSFRKVTIQCKRPNTLVRAKSGYYAR